VTDETGRESADSSGPANSPSLPSAAKPTGRSSSPAVSSQDDPARAMDRMYRVTRHIYDLTRRYYLLGRDRMLDRVVTHDGTATLEVGCGTARNLIKLAKRRNCGSLYGLDASHEMLETAASSIRKAGVGEIVLRQGLAEQLDARKMFGREDGFDTIFFSYCLSMVPAWEGAIEAALTNLKPGGQLVIVDFWDQADLPRWFAAGLKKWLALFHVFYRPDVHTALTNLGSSGRADVSFESVKKRYAYIAIVRKQ
jgi:S-adenosylmethionine-diacylgycerolhomoserine-N-methlytransferase